LILILVPKSQRSLEADEEIFQSDLKVSASMQEFIAKKLSKIIDDQIEFVQVKPKKLKDKEVDRLKLLKDSQDFVKLENPEEKEFLKNRKKIPILKRSIEEDETSESQKQKLVAVDVDQIQSETKSWTSRKKGKVYEYKVKNSVGYLKEPTNEFTKMRNKNQWNETKISKAKYFGKGLEGVSQIDDTT
jgi:hypothetical protein